MPHPFIRQFCKDERGAALIEYSVLIGIITFGACSMILTVGAWINNQWADLNPALQNCEANPNAGDPNSSDNAQNNAACGSAANNSN